MKLAKCAMLLALALPQFALAHQAGDFFVRAGVLPPHRRLGQCAGNGVF